MDLEPLVVNEFFDNITPALPPEVPFVLILFILTAFSCPDKHGKGATTIIQRFTDRM
jgi:hypothetical protein